MSEQKMYISSHEEISEKIQKAQNALSAWKHLPIDRRTSYLNSLKNVIYKERERIATCIVEESGRIPFSADGLIFEILNTFSVANDARKIFNKKGDVKLNRLFYRTKQCYTVYEPYGVVGVIAPTNSPFFESFQQAIQALLMGNTVVMKPPESSPRISLIMEELIQKTSLPAGVVNVIHGGPSVGEALVCSQGVDKIFIFSTLATGRKVIEASAKTIKPLFLGLEGPEPAIVLDDCNMSRTVDGLVYGAFCHSGQNCSCTRKVFVMRKIADQLLKKLAERVQMLKLSSLDDMTNEIGMIKKKSDAHALISAVEQAKSKGARIVIGGLYEEKINRISPLIITDVKPDMSIMRNAFIGPYLCFYIVDSVEEAINSANDTIYGLSASVWTSNYSEAERIARHIKTGTVTINDTQFYHYQVPYGGIKHSGYGKTGGREGLLNFVTMKTICIERSTKNNFYWFPYKREKMNLMRKMLVVKHDPHIVNRIKSIMNLFIAK